MIIILKDTPTWQAYSSIFEKVLETVHRDCPDCNCKDALIGHGKRKRLVIGLNSQEHILVQRMRCKYCGKTYTVHPEFLIKRYCIIRDVVTAIKRFVRGNWKILRIQYKLQELFNCGLLAISNIYRWSMVTIPNSS
jgi:transposase-like protein